MSLEELKQVPCILVASEDQQEIVKEYPINYRECTAVAQDELKANARPELKEYLDNIDEYEVILLVIQIGGEQCLFQ